MTTQRLMSGIQPTGQLHLGNYLGAVKNWVELQHDYESVFCIVDWHSLTSMYNDPSALRQNKHELALDLLALGIDPKQAILFFQSDVPGHSELHLILSMLTPTPWLTRVPTYKDKQLELTDKNLDTYGFLGYPVLQAADILLYQAGYIPVGKDQAPHLELTREIARRFNHLYGSTFSEPKEILTEMPLLPGTDGEKMSKSKQNTLPLADSAELTEKKILRMKTDPARARLTDPGNPDHCPVYTYHKIFSNSDTQLEINDACRKASIGCVDCKRKMATNLNNALAAYRDRRQTLANKPDDITAILDDGATRARTLANETLTIVKSKIGI